ncbi:MAG: hypothetical protein IKJ19_00995 [Clostridia bacterium]|nr:hypothetical protein [Clostridia bacterium]
MKKSKILLLIVCVLTFVSALFAFSACDNQVSDDNKVPDDFESSNITYEIADGYLYFGRYPQTIKAENVTITSTINENGYCLGSDGEWYAKITVANQPYNASNYAFTNGISVNTGDTHYFKLEPIKWQILANDGESVSVVCASIIVNKPYDDGSNNYAQSKIRAWLNDEFYNTAFNNLQKELILTTEVDNSAESAGYPTSEYGLEVNNHVSANTHDKIYLLSYQEILAFNEACKNAKMLERLTSDYARAMGAEMITTTQYYGNGFWWLRSPKFGELAGGGLDFIHTSPCARLVWADGNITGVSDVFTEHIGVVPALQIRLNVAGE